MKKKRKVGEEKRDEERKGDEEMKGWRWIKERLEMNKGKVGEE